MNTMTTLGARLRDQADDLVARALGDAPVTAEARERLVDGALHDPRARDHVRRAEHARGKGDDVARWRELWRALDVAGGRA